MKATPLLHSTVPGTILEEEMKKKNLWVLHYTFVAVYTGIVELVCKLKEILPIHLKLI